MAESKQSTVNEEYKSKDESSDRSSCLRLYYSSSPFKGHRSTSVDSDEEGSQCSVVPYLYELERESGSEAESGASSDEGNWLEERLLNSDGKICSTFSNK